MTNTGTATLTSTASGIEVAFAGGVLGTIKDGARLVQRADALLQKAAIYRADGFRQSEGLFVAPAVQFL